MQQPYVCFPPTTHSYWVHCSVGKEWSHHRQTSNTTPRLTLANDANVKSYFRHPFFRVSPGCYAVLGGELLKPMAKPKYNA